MTKIEILQKAARMLTETGNALPSDEHHATAQHVWGIVEDLENEQAKISADGVARAFETLTVKEAAQRYRVSEETIKRRVRSGEIAAIRTAGAARGSGTGGKILLKREDLDKFFVPVYA